jgi:hypothetical protein
VDEMDAACIGKIRNSYKILVRKCEDKLESLDIDVRII